MRAKTDLPTLYSEVVNSGQRLTVRYVDVLTRLNNAVVLTRVVDPDATGAPDLLTHIRKPVNQPLRRAVARAADVGAAVLEDLPTRS